MNSKNKLILYDLHTNLTLVCKFEKTHKIKESISTDDSIKNYQILNFILPFIQIYINNRDSQKD